MDYSFLFLFILLFLKLLPIVFFSFYLYTFHCTYYSHIKILKKLESRPELTQDYRNTPCRHMYTKPRSWNDDYIARVIRLAKLFGCRSQIITGLKHNIIFFHMTNS